jgi:hypothetical protein
MKFEWNKKTGWTLLAQRTATMAVFRLVRLIFMSVQRVFWELNGTAKQVREAEDPRYYERSAHVLDVVMERHFCEQQNHAIEHFICVHNRFENPQFVIDNEHITLFTINEQHAVFGVAREKGKKCLRPRISQNKLRYQLLHNVKNCPLIQLSVTLSLYQSPAADL